MKTLKCPTHLLNKADALVNDHVPELHLSRIFANYHKLELNFANILPEVLCSIRASLHFD